MSVLKDLPRRALGAGKAWLPKHEIYIDRGIIILNKPPGLVTQGTSAVDSDSKSPHALRTDFDSVLHDLKRKYNSETTPFPIHRLDKATTGALVLARTKAFAQQLAQQFHSHTVEKSYFALVRGGAKTFPVGSGEIQGDLYINDGRVSVKKPKPFGDSESRTARTGWEVLASSSSAPISLVRFQLYTGLKHQLRVHAASALGAPILGDTLYGSARLSPQIATITHIPQDRLFLHSSSITFQRFRRDGQHKRFQLTVMAPLPRDFVVICGDLGIPLEENVVKGGVFVDGQVAENGQVSSIEGKWLLSR
ncbi:pseudouridine synthase [Artomyces pyxidatus]|uniref:Pseudouridine synthase n=1 Tax=Artomyces pyxidatus TaxID=48021 RepID=A0ACB8SPB4_9AGAM|nr:pseudouridine synthase [Artomyces pyxidatus]